MSRTRLDDFLETIVDAPGWSIPVDEMIAAFLVGETPNSRLYYQFETLANAIADRGLLRGRLDGRAVFGNVYWRAMPFRPSLGRLGDRLIRQLE